MRLVGRGTWFVMKGNGWELVEFRILSTCVFLGELGMLLSSVSVHYCIGSSSYIYIFLTYGDSFEADSLGGDGEEQGDLFFLLKSVINCIWGSDS